MFPSFDNHYGVGFDRTQLYTKFVTPFSALLLEIVMKRRRRLSGGFTMRLCAEKVYHDKNRYSAQTHLSDNLMHRHSLLEGWYVVQLVC